MRNPIDKIFAIGVSRNLIAMNASVNLTFVSLVFEVSDVRSMVDSLKSLDTRGNKFVHETESFKIKIKRWKLIHRVLHTWVITW